MKFHGNQTKKNSNLISKVKKYSKQPLVQTGEFDGKPVEECLCTYARAQTDAQVENIMPSAAQRKAVEG